MKITAYIAAAILARGVASVPLQNDPREIRKDEVDDLPPMTTFVSPDGLVEPVPEDSEEETTATGLPFNSRPDDLEMFPTVVDDIPDEELDKTDTSGYPAHHQPSASHHHDEGFNASSSNSTVWKELLQAYYGKDADSEDSKHPEPKFIYSLKDLLSGHFKDLMSAGEVAAPSQAADEEEAQANEIEPRSVDQVKMWKEQFGDKPMPDHLIKHIHGSRHEHPISASQTTKPTTTSPSRQPDSVESSVSEFSLPYCPGGPSWRPSDHYVDMTHCALVHVPMETPSQHHRRQDDDDHIYKNGNNLLYKVMNPSEDNSLNAETFHPKNNIDYVGFHQKRDEHGWDVEGHVDVEFENPWNHQTTEVDADIDWWSDWKRENAAVDSENGRDTNGEDLPKEDHVSQSDEDEKSQQGIARFKDLANFASSRLSKSRTNVTASEEERRPLKSLVDALHFIECHIMSKAANSTDECLHMIQPSTSTQGENQINKRDVAGQVEKLENELGAKIAAAMNQPFKPFNFSASAHHSVHKNHTKSNPFRHKHNSTRSHYPHPHHPHNPHHTPLAIDGEAAYQRFHAKDFKPSHPSQPSTSSSFPYLSTRDDPIPTRKEKGYPYIKPSEEFSKENSIKELNKMIDQLAKIHHPEDRWHNNEEMTPQKEKELREWIRVAYERAGYDPALPVVKPVDKEAEG